MRGKIDLMAAKVIPFVPKSGAKIRKPRKKRLVSKKVLEWIYWIGAIYIADLLAYLTVIMMGKNP